MNKKRKEQLDIEFVVDGTMYDQKSFLNGVEVPYGSKGSTREGPPQRSIETKNYNKDNHYPNMIKSLKKQFKDRERHFPKDVGQEAHIDISGQHLKKDEMEKLRADLEEIGYVHVGFWK